MMWKKLIENDCHECMLVPVDYCERNIGRSGVRSTMPAASQLSGGVESTDVVDDATAPACYHKHDDGGGGADDDDGLSF